MKKGSELQASNVGSDNERGRNEGCELHSWNAWRDSEREMKKESDRSVDKRSKFAKTEHGDSGRRKTEHGDIGRRKTEHVGGLLTGRSGSFVKNKPDIYMQNNDGATEHGRPIFPSVRVITSLFTTTIWIGAIVSSEMISERRMKGKSRGEMNGFADGMMTVG